MGIVNSLPDDFYELTTSELKYLMSSQRKQADSYANKPLMTRELREQEQRKAQLAKQERYPRTLIRVRFPDQTLLEARFSSRETLRNVYDVVRQNLYDSSRPFHLCTFF
jgi:tether containing UBX domain for GLUT4